MATTAASQPHHDDSKENDTISDRLTATKNIIASASATTFSKRKPLESKYSGSRKSSEDTTGIRRHIRMENTYKLSPDYDKRFVTYKIQSKIHELVAERVKESEASNPTYVPKVFAALTRELADSIRREAKNLGVPRYKILAHVTIGENLGQDTRVASRCLWNTDFDNSITITYNTKRLFIVASLYVLYSE